MAALAGSALLKAATGEDSSNEELGGAEMHSVITGLVEYLANDDLEAINITRDLVNKLNWQDSGKEDKSIKFKDPKYTIDEVPGIVPIDYKRGYDIREVIARIVDGSEFTEFKEKYGITMVCCWTKIAGYPVGIIASNGVIFAESAQKATQFIQLANKSNLPLLFMHNTTGFMVGKSYEQNGMINSGSQMIHAVAGSTVPHISLLIGNSYGAGNYAMCGRSFSPRFLFSYPNVKAGVMGAEQLAGVMEIIKRNSAASNNTKVDEKLLKKEKEAIKKDAQAKASVWHATSELWDDGVIDPRNTREHLTMALATIYQNPIEGADSFGVFRM